MGERATSMTRRELLSMIGATAGSAAMYQAMTSLGFAADSGYKGPIQLSGAPAGASVLVLGAGIAGLVAAYELRKAGYQVQVLEYNSRAGGRNWTLRGGDRYTELGGFTQECRFDPGLYINPGPWRLPYHHRGMLSYCKLLGVQLEPFVQMQLQRVPSSYESVRRQAPALPHHQGRLPRSRRRASRQDRAEQESRRLGDDGRPAAPVGLAARVGRTRRPVPLRRRPYEQRPAGLRERPRRRPRRHARLSPSRCSCRKSCAPACGRP